MHRAYVLAGLAACVAACAAPATVTPVRGDVANPSAVAAGEPNTPADGDDAVIEMVDAPQAATVAATPVLLTRQERVCHREKRTGTNRVVRVCRTRAEIERDELESKEVFDELHRSQQEYNR